MAQPSGIAPALKPPAGLTSNFEAHNSVAKWNTLCVSVCLSVITIFFLLRVYIQIGIKGQWILEDWMCLFSWAGIVTFSALLTTSMYHHGGVHQWNVPASEVSQANYWFNLITVVYGPGMLCTKLAILLLYRRIFMPHKLTLFDRATRVFMAVLCAFYIASTIAKIWECTPRSKIWDKEIPGRCVDRSKLFTSSGIFNTVTDVIILLIPVKVVWKLQIDKKRKLGIILVFTVGSTAPVFSIVGLVVRLKISNSPDATYNQPKIYLWALAELTVGLICACTPILATLINRRRLASQRQYVPNKKYPSNRAYPLRTKPNLPSLEGESLFDPATLELVEASCPTIPVATARTDGKGGVDGTNGTEKNFKIHHLEQEENRVAGNGILKTVRVEHTFA